MDKEMITAMVQETIARFSPLGEVVDVYLPPKYMNILDPRDIITRIESGAFEIDNVPVTASATLELDEVFVMTKAKVT